nr:hypothetical protein [Rhizobium binae]
MALLPDSTPDDAAVVAERVRLAIEMAEIPCRAASCSRSRRVSDVPAGQTTAQAETSRILSNADLALYAANLRPQLRRFGAGRAGSAAGGAPQDSFRRWFRFPPMKNAAYCSGVSRDRCL